MTAWIRGHASSSAGDRDLEDAFPNRWNPRRAIQDDLRALGQAVADATREAGWWEPGSTVSAGLVLGIDLHGWGHMEQFEGTLQKLARGEQAALRPSTFLYALPSTPASTLGLLFGLDAYQATINQLGQSGFAALDHATDLLATGRLDRVVVAALSAVSTAVAERLPPPFEAQAAPFCLATALCLDVDTPAAARGIASCEVGAHLEPPEGSIESETLLCDLPTGYRGLSAPSLLAIARAKVNNTVVHRDLCFEGLGVARVVGAQE